MLFFRRKSKFERKYPILHAIIIGSGVVFFWRGLWGLLDMYFFPDYPTISFILCIFVGFCLLYLTNHLTDELE